MRDLDRLEQAADESPREYLLHFLEVISLVHNADSVQAACSFVWSLQPGSMLSDHLLLNLPYDMADVQTKSEGVFRMLESHLKAPKTSATITTTSVQPPTLQGVKRPLPGQGPASKQEVPVRDGLEGGKRRKTTRDPLPKYELNTLVDVIYLQNRDMGIFKDPPKSGVPEHMKNRNRYCQFYKDFGHNTVHCRNLYAQVMLAIYAGRLKQYMKTDEAMPWQDITRTEKGKQAQASGSGEQTLRIVPTIVGRPEPTHDQEEKERCLRRAEDRAKRLRGIGHSVNHLMSGESCTPAALIIFTQQDLTTDHLQAYMRQIEEEPDGPESTIEELMLSAQDDGTLRDARTKVPVRRALNPLQHHSSGEAEQPPQ
ncbi:hypothetical protein PanWU01x14_131150 [Parasponia andersonii]|uniref:Retrotransposon gag domain-containing protein n=1 Tax=Parasponia andersonii TaxID=3476 RepID=A0A2P5CQZ1_PARAD|nr:hypothetical protein PanWU01x14_131150 [Parasponia andersonii]